MKTNWQQFNMLQEVITWFGENPKARRSQGAKHCLYNPPNNKPESIGCAIGMYLPVDVAARCDALPFTNISDVLDGSPHLLPAWMRSMDKGFLTQLQGLHDHETYWSKVGLTEDGVRKVRYICTDYNLPFDLLDLTPTTSNLK